MIFERHTPSDANHPASGKFWRLGVEYDSDDGPVHIYERQMTSAVESAIAVKNSLCGLVLSPREAEWLHRTLGDLLVERRDAGLEDDGEST